MLRKVPLIVILGSTGTGKTKLSLELAERFGGEIISADSMQVYANLNIATAKATKEEQARARHHLLDVATPADPFTVVHFRNAALPIIEQLLAKSKPPIVVGGTNYYIESLLWDVLVSEEFEAHSAHEDLLKPKVPNALSASDMSAMSSDALHKHLQQFDMPSANRIHPNNRRKIIRAIEYYQSTGETLTSKLLEQRQQPGGNRLGGPLRYPHTILFWLRCKQEVLDERLDKRVDGMLAQGLLQEIRAFHNKYNVADAMINSYTKGVLQTIGYKEFIPYLMKYDAENDAKIEDYLQQHEYKLPPTILQLNEKLLPPGLDLLHSCLNELKLVTRRYSKKQIKWINNRFLGSKDRLVPDLYELDTSDVQLWSEKVYKLAELIIDCYRNEEICEVQPMPKREHPSADLDEETSHFCSTCQRHFIGEYQWRLHLRSNKHKRCKESLRRRIESKQQVVEEGNQQIVEEGTQLEVKEGKQQAVEESQTTVGNNK